MQGTHQRLGGVCARILEEKTMLFYRVVKILAASSSY
jgi:hypothetical protein